MSKKLVIELSDETFAYLEMIATGLQIEENGKVESEWDGYSKDKNDFSPAVRQLLVSVADSMADGVRRSGSWERQVVDQLTGWQGTYNEGLLADCIKSNK